MPYAKTQSALAKNQTSCYNIFIDRRPKSSPSSEEGSLPVKKDEACSFAVCHTQPHPETQNAFVSEHIQPIYNDAASPLWKGIMP